MRRCAKLRKRPIWPVFGRRWRISGQGGFTVTDQWGVARDYSAVLVTCQSHLLTTSVAVDEALGYHYPLSMVRPPFGEKGG